MLVIRLSRTGRRNQPKFRLVVTEDGSKLTGKPVAMLGHYIPTDKAKPFVYDKEAVTMWLSRGAQPSNTVAKILNGEGFDLAVHKYQPGKPKKAAPEPKAPAPTGPQDGAAAPVAPAEESTAEATEVAVENAMEEAKEEAAAEEVPVEEVATEEAAEAVETPEEIKAEEAAEEEASDEAAA